MIRSARFGFRHGLSAARRSLLWVALVGVAASQAAAQPRLEYNRDIRPILFDQCFACHGPDSAARKAELRLDQRDAAVGMTAIVPGKPDESELVRRILSDDPAERMPPPETKKTLTAAQKEKLVRWIREGGEYQLHWSFLPPKRPAVPKVKHADRVRNPIDNFIFARLEGEGLSPAPEADRRTLARRVSLDLTGLPPAPETVEAFVDDPSPGAYEKLVDQLLDSKPWGEHRGRHWLDYARYADTHGIHFDNYREMWSYRDWVIDAFNRNMPYDQFTIENLAGDLLPDRTLSQQIGSGFNRCQMTTNEGGIIDEEYLVLYARERTETTAQVWLGLTAGCAVCHSHKFDPLSQKEFYELAAFFNNTTQAARDGNVKDTPPIVMVPGDADQAAWKSLEAKVAAAKQQAEARRAEARPEFDRWLSSAKEADLLEGVPREGLAFAAPLNEGEGRVLRVTSEGQEREVALAQSATWQAGPTPSAKALQVQGSAAEMADVGGFEKDTPFSCSAWIRLPANDSAGAICARMDNGNVYRGWDFWVQQRRIGMHVINSWPNAGLKVVGRNQVKANTWVHVAVTYDGSGKAAGVKVYYDGEPQPTNVENDRLSGTIRTDVPFRIGQRNSSDPLSAATLQDLRVYKRTLAAAEVASLAKLMRYSDILARAAPQRTVAEKNELYGWWLGAFDPKFQAHSAEVTKFEQEQAAIKARGTIAHVMQEKPSPAMAFVLYRGEYDQRRDQVTPSTPAVLPPFPADQPRNRLGLAKWLLLPEHPLTARVTVNRFWQEVFGQGLVRTAGDFGVSGELPSHPELLDWLAVEFRGSGIGGQAPGRSIEIPALPDTSPNAPADSPPATSAPPGWDVKRLFKLLVTSAAYRQSATVTPLKLEKDPQNRLLSRGPRFRMDAEMVRDNALAVSGLLVPKIGGPSVKPYQPEGVWEAIAMNVSNTRAYQRDTGEGLYRRSLYTFWKRMAPPASMDLFNAPNREFCVVRRERTNTPLQALVTLNDEQHVEAARHLATRALKDGGDTFEGRLRIMSVRLLAREFRAEERRVVEASLVELRDFYKQHPDDARKLIAVGESKPDATLDPATLAAWTMLANELLNLDEVLNK